MAATVSPITFALSIKNHPVKSPSKNFLFNPLITGKNTTRLFLESKTFFTFQNSRSQHLGRFVSSYIRTRLSSSDGFLDITTQDKKILPFAEEKPWKYLLWVLFWASLSLVWSAASSDANASSAAADSIRASDFGLKIATALRSSGWPDEVVVFALATLPIVELRGAIPVGYWMQLHPMLITVLSVLGNMIPVPFIILYLKRYRSASGFLDLLFKRAKEKAGPVKEFQWLGLMLFVAVPFPGTGAWTGAFITAILDMPFWSGLSANFVGVVLAGLLVNLLVNLGLKYAIITGIILFFISTFMWTILRKINSSLSSSDRC
ncbi:uncharacterized protein LOC123214986 [Mangifera indica]|uniref:uncharacterized protein LOC123214986 n=1 Tax=Mangifera indica TaxID=29780 RepID=UPI001CFBD741|nr:uncharacterized protein LOC123214986 [Mangifera indica]